MKHFLDFEKPIAELEGKINELRKLSDADGMDIEEEVSKLNTKLDRLVHSTYAKLSPWQKTQVARHPQRPHCQDYIDALIEDFTPLAGDRLFAEDDAIIGGLGRFRGRAVMVIGHEKGHDTPTRLKHNFGMARPEGYRKAQRLMRMADHFQLPILTLVDTAGAYPGIDAEARGQAEAIAQAIAVCLDVRVPLLSVIIGEGGSGGAIAIAAANHVMMLEHSVYSVISPEGCASILWRSASEAQIAAEALRLTAQDLTQLGVTDEVVNEPIGGAHRDPKATIEAIGEALYQALENLESREGGSLRRDRRDKFLAMGQKGLN